MRIGATWLRTTGSSGSVRLRLNKVKPHESDRFLCYSVIPATSNIRGSSVIPAQAGIHLLTIRLGFPPARE